LVFVSLLLAMGCTPADDEVWPPPCPKPKPTRVAYAGLAGRIAYKTSAGGGAHCYEVFVINADGSEIRQLTQPETVGFNLQWSPDGRRVALEGTCGREWYDICIIEADGTGLRAITKGPGSNREPAWSPDGSRIAFTKGPEGGGNRDIYVVGADGTGETRITDDPGDERDPTWSPDGASLAYVARSGAEKIQLIPVSGGTPRVLTAEGTSNESPAFSHDGKRIAFSSDRSAKPESAYTAKVRGQPGSESLPVTSAHDIFVVDVGGRGVTRLTSDASANYTPVWSPDDRHIAFISDRDERQELYVMGADGTNPVRLSQQEGDAGSPSWTR
jgi:Tol biopolymer transport system component